MKWTATVLFLLVIAAAAINAQPTRRRVAKPAATPSSAAKPAAAAIDKGSVSGRTYTNAFFGLNIEFPMEWLIPGDDFESYMKSQGFDISIKAPEWMPAASRARWDNELKKLTVLVTAYRAMPGTPDNAVARISAENLASQPQIKDAVDYIDAVINNYKAMKLQLPKDFKYSETQVETLGDTQLGFIDTSSGAEKKRLYVLVRKRYAILMAFSYTKSEDLARFRRILDESDLNYTPKK